MFGAEVEKAKLVMDMERMHAEQHRSQKMLSSIEDFEGGWVSVNRHTR
jgi:hypothetical protein